MTALMTGIVDSQWNYEHLVVYPITILQHKKGLAISQDNCWRIQHRMDLQDQGYFKALTDDMDSMNSLQQPTVQKM